MERVILTGEIVSGHNIQQAGPGMFHRDLRKRTILLMLFGILLFGAAPRMQIASTTIPAASARKPNVLFLFADDMRADSIAALGNPAVKTPNLDAIVRRGFVMSNAYCLGGNIPAVCTPSRNMLLSGNAYFRWRDHVIQRDHVTQKAQGQQRGLLAPGDAPNFPLSLKDAGTLLTITVSVVIQPRSFKPSSRSTNIWRTTKATGSTANPVARLWTRPSDF
jgi:hypothetical protein